MNKELLDKAITSLAIKDVLVSGANLHLSKKYDPLFPTIEELAIQFRHGIDSFEEKTVTSQDANEDIRVVIFNYECAFRALPPGLDKEVLNNADLLSEEILIEAVATFSAYYLTTEEVDKDALNEFAQYNVGYHVWPYWREYASSIASRLRMPSFTIPLYRTPK
jgi:hypothetical protein